MKKKILTMLLAAVLVVSLAACGSGGKEATEKSANKSAASEDKKQAETKDNDEAGSQKEDTTKEPEKAAEETPEVVTGPYETELEAGDYYVGSHIPEGVYNVEVVSGLGNMMTKSGIVTSLGSGTGVEYASTYENAALKNVDVLKLTQSLKVKISTQEATFSTMTGYENTAKEEKEFGPGDYLIGQDITPGYYDISVVSGTIVNVSLTDGAFTGMFSSDPAMAESAGSSYKNVAFREGATLKVSTGSIKITPMANVTPITP